MTTSNSTIIKLAKKINYNLANNFELTATKDFSFVPVNMQTNSATGEEVFFVAVCKDSDQTKIKNYVAKFINNNVNFIKLSTQDFEILFETFSKKYCEMFGGTIPKTASANEDTLIIDDNDSISISDEQLNLGDSIDIIDEDMENADSIVEADEKTSNYSVFDSFDSDVYITPYNVVTVIWKTARLAQ